MQKLEHSSIYCQAFDSQANFIWLNCSYRYWFVLSDETPFQEKYIQMINIFVAHALYKRLSNQATKQLICLWISSGKWALCLRRLTADMNRTWTKNWLKAFRPFSNHWKLNFHLTINKRMRIDHAYGHTYNVLLWFKR